MNSLLSLPNRLARGLRSLVRPRTARELLAGGAVVFAFALAVMPAVAPPPYPTQAQLLQVYVSQNAQTLRVADGALAASATRDGYAATPGIQTLVNGGTNYDWAKLVMLFAGFPITDSNVAVFTRWMRQENGADDWWNRNNPLNNGWGSGGGGGTGSYDNLVIAAQNCAEALHSVGGYSEIVAGFASGAPTNVIESAIWNSPWASGHYDYGGHWSSVPVTVVTAPAEAWG